MFSAPSALAQGDCATAVTTGPSSTVTIDTTGTADTLIVPCTGSTNDSNDYWVEFTGLTAGLNYTATSSANGGITDTVLQIFEGADCGSAVSVGCNDDIDLGGGNFFSEVTFTTQAGMRYWAFNDTEFSDGAGTWDLSIDGGVTPPVGPPNDLCSMATVIASLPFSDNTTDTTGANDEGIDSNAAVGGGGGGGFDVWYTYTPAGNETVRVDFVNTNFDMGGGLFDGADCMNLNEIDSVDFFFMPGDSDSFIADLTGGTQYWFLVEGFTGADVGVIDFSVSLAPTATGLGDDCASAVTLTPGTPVSADTTSFANLATLTGCGDTLPLFGNDAWFTASGLNTTSAYSFTTSSAGASPVNGTFVEVSSTTTGCAGLMPMPCSATTGGSFDAVTFTPAAGETYYFFVESEVSDEGGTFDVVLTEIPLAAGDACATAVALAPASSVSADTTSSADLQGVSCVGDGFFEPFDPGGNDFWAELTGLTPGLIYTVETTTGTGGGTPVTDTGMELWSGADCASAVMVDCNDDGTNGSFSQITFTATADSFYVFATGVRATLNGGFDVALSAGTMPGPGEECAQALPGPAVGGSINVSTVGLLDTGNPSCAPTGPDVWHTLGVLAAGDYIVETSADTSGSATPTTDTVLEVFVGPCPGTSVDCDDEGGVGSFSQVIFTADGVSEYFTLSGDFSTGEGDFDMSLTQLLPPANDTCAAPTNIAAVPFSDSVSTLAATDNGFDTSVTSEAGASEVWYTFNPATTGDYRIDATGYDTVVGVYEGLTCPPSGTIVAEVDNSTSGESLIVALTSGTNYTIVVEGDAIADVGTLAFSIDQFILGPGDECAQALAGPAAGASVTVDNTGGPDVVDSSCQANTGPEQWYTLGVLAADNYRLTTENDGGIGDTVISVFTGPCGSLTEVDCDDDSGPGLLSLIDFTADGVSEYFVLAQSFSTGEGTFTLSLAIPAPPANNDCATATVVGALPFTDTVDMSLATDSGTDNSASVAATGGGGADVWYSFTPAMTADYDIIADGFDSGIGVFSAPCVGAELAAIDATLAGELLTVSLNAGVEVLILAEGFDAAATAGATLSFSIDLAPLPPDLTRPGFAWVQNIDFVNFDADDGEAVTIGSAAASNYIGGDFMGSDGSTFFAFNATDGTLDSVDTASGAITAGPLVSGAVAPFDFPINLAWDSSTSTFYAGMADGATFSGGAIGTIDPGTGVFAELANYGSTQSVQSIAVDAAGNLFALTYDIADSTGALTLNSVDKGTGALTAIGATGIGTGQFSEMDFNDGNGLLYLQVLEARGDVGNPGPNEIYTLDTATGAATLATPVQADVTFFALGFVGQNAGVDNWSDY